MATPQTPSNMMLLQPGEPVNFTSNQEIIRPVIRYRRFHQGYGITLMVIAALTILLEAVRLNIIVKSDSTNVSLFTSGVGIWSGIFMFIPGILSYFASTKSSRSCLAGALAMDVLGIITICTAFSLAIVEIKKSYYYTGHRYNSNGYSGGQDDSNTQDIKSLKTLHEGVSSYMILISSILFFLMLVHFGYCCKDVCLCCSKCCGICCCCCCYNNIPSTNTGSVPYGVQYSNTQSTQNTVQYIQIPSIEPNSSMLNNIPSAPSQLMPITTIPRNDQPPTYSEGINSKVL